MAKWSALIITQISFKNGRFHRMFEYSHERVGNKEDCMQNSGGTKRKIALFY